MNYLKLLYNTLDREYTHVKNDASYCVERKGSVLKIFFEWSNGTLDWLHNLNFPARPYKRMQHTWFAHRGFLKVWKTIEPLLHDVVINPDIRYIQIAGYSHGAAIALLCYEYCAFHRPDLHRSGSLRGVGFGGPRVFWGPCKKCVKRRFDGFTLIRNGHDIVTHVPPAVFGFRHVSEVLKVGRSTDAINDHSSGAYITALREVADDDT